MSEHSILSPSAGGVWGSPKGCPGYVTAAQMFPDLEQTPEDMEGTATHWVGEGMIQSHATGHTFDRGVGTVAPNGVVITREMYNGAEEWAGSSIEILKNPMVKEWGVEQRISIPRIHELCFGTPDFWAFSRGEGVLWVDDFKYGHRWVSEFENWQLIAYTAGLLDLLGINGSTDQHIRVRLRVIQPRAYGAGGTIRQWEVMASGLRAHINIMRGAAEEALGGNPTYRSGPHCRDCPARGGRCEAATGGGFTLYEAATKALPHEVGPHEVGILLEIVERAAKQLEYIQTGLEAQAAAYMKAGHNVPGRLIATTYGREKWDKPAHEVLALASMFGWDFEKPEGERDQYANLLTPAKVKSKFPIDGDIIKAYCKIPVTGSKVTKNKHNQVERLFKR